MTATIQKFHLPDAGEGQLFKGSGIPLVAMDELPAGIKIGDIVRFGGKTFVMGRLGATITNTQLGLKNGLHQTISQAVLPAAAADGATTISITVGASDGAAADGAVAADELYGGQVVVFQSGTSLVFCRGIVGNTAIAAGGGTITIDLDSPIPYALTVSDAAEAMHSQYYKLIQDNAINHVPVGLPTISGTSGQYIWDQTWGTCFISPQSGVGVAYSQACYWRHDGSIDVVGNIGTYVSDVCCGHVWGESSSATQSAPFINLQVTP